jgi:hypothetical protein
MYQNIQVLVPEYPGACTRISRCMYQNIQVHVPEYPGACTRISRCMYQLIREEIEMKLHAKNIHHKTVLSHADRYSLSSVLLTAQSRRHSLGHDSLMPPEMLQPQWVLIMTLRPSTFHFPFSTHILSPHFA